MADVYVARKRLKVGDHYVLPGEEIPEAAQWRNLHSYVHSGAVTLVQTEVEHPYGFKQRIPTEPDRKDWQIQPQIGHPDQMHGWGSQLAAEGQGQGPDGGGPPGQNKPPKFRVQRGQASR